jgi:hypothetical protein
MGKAGGRRFQVAKATVNWTATACSAHSAADCGTQPGRHGRLQRVRDSVTQHHTLHKATGRLHHWLQVGVIFLQSSLHSGTADMCGVACLR